MVVVAEKKCRIFRAGGLGGVLKIKSPPRLGNIGVDSDNFSGPSENTTGNYIKSGRGGLNGDRDNWAAKERKNNFV